MNPYALAADRARALYRIPTAPEPQRSLEILCGRASLLEGSQWTGDDHRSWVLDAASPGTPTCGDKAGKRTVDFETAPFSDQSFDLVILHRTLDDIAAPVADAARLLAQAVRLLVPGGVLAGCTANRHDPRQLLSGIRGRTAPLARFSPGRLKSVLEDASLVDVRLFNLLPNCDDPLRLIDMDARISRLAYRRELETHKRHLSGRSYLVRRIVVETGLSRHLEAALFFWGYRPC